MEHPTVAAIKADPASIFTLAGRTPDRWQYGLLTGAAKQVLLLCSRQAGKSTTAAALALLTALTQSGALVLLLSPTLRQSGELFRDKVLRLYAALDRPVPSVQESQLQITFANGSRIISLPGDEETIRGYSGVALLVIDEAARVPDDLYRAVRPMLAVSGGRLVCLSTPFGKQGWFYREWTGAGPWERIMVTAHECPRIKPEFLEEERRALGEQWYQQEYLCTFSDSAGDPLFPSEVLENSARLAKARGPWQQPRYMGVDPAEGGDKTAWAVVDRLGLILLAAEKTPDTTTIRTKTLMVMRELGIQAENVVFDRGGGGKQIADELRAAGHAVRTVAFGESVTPEPRRGRVPLGERLEQREERYQYVNRRAEMYGELARLVSQGFALPGEYVELHRQLRGMPKLWDPEGRLRMLPKHKRGPDSTEQTLSSLLGCSPDEADAVALACHGLLNKPRRVVAGAC